MSNEERFEQIERYIRNEMVPGERVAFEALLRTDAALMEEMNLHAGVHQVVADTRRVEFLQTLALAGRDYFSDELQTGGSRKSRVWYWSAAAAVVLLAAVGVFLLMPTGRPAPEDLFTAYFEHYEVPAVLRSEGALYQDADAQQAFLHYSQKEYAAAIPLFTKTLDQSPDVMLVVFSRGICYLATGETGAAVQDFQTVIQHGDNLFVAQARWYLALAYLRAGRADPARSVLSQLDDARAKALLKEME